MEINFFQTSLSDLNKEKTLRFDVKFHSVFTKIIKARNTVAFLNFFEIGKKEYHQGHELNEIKYVEIGSVTSDGDINVLDLSDNKRLDLAEKERLVKKIENGDIFKPERDSLLIASVRPNLKKFVWVSEEEQDFYFTKAFIYIRPKRNLIKTKLLKYLLRTVLFDHLVGLCREGKGYPTLKEEDLKFFFIDSKLMKKLKSNSAELLKKIDENERAILQIKLKIESIQDIIEEVFVKYGVKNEQLAGGHEKHFSIHFQKVGDNLFLRLGAQYYTFFDVHKGLLFDENGMFKQVPLCQLVRKHKVQVLKKGILEKPYTLIDLEQLEAKTGRILNETNEVEEIGSDKVVFGDADIVISKIDPYLSYIFINDKSRNLIGTTELVPFKLNANIDVSYLKYCLLSNEYIEKSALIMYGKRHPRIHIKDLLSIKIPLPSLEIQRKIVSEIQQREEKSNQYRKKIKKLREEIDNLIYNNLGYFRKIKPRKAMLDQSANNK